MLTLEVQLYRIYYKKENDKTLYSVPATKTDGRLTLKEARAILNERDISYSFVIKVSKVTEFLTISIDDYNKGVL